MKVREILAQIGDGFLDLEATALVMIAACEEAPIVASNVPPEVTQKLMKLIIKHGDWSDTVKVSHPLH